MRYAVAQPESDDPYEQTRLARDGAVVKHRAVPSVVKSSAPSDLRDGNWAGPVTVRYADGHTETRPAYTPDEIRTILTDAKLKKDGRRKRPVAA